MSVYSASEEANSETACQQVLHRKTIDFCLLRCAYRRNEKLQDPPVGGVVCLVRT